MKKSMIIISLLCVILAVLPGCQKGGDGQDKPAQDNNINVPADNAESESIPEETTEEYRFEKLDFNGETVNFLYSDWSHYPLYYFAEEQNGDATNDAVYRRMIETEEFYNVKFQTVETDANDWLYDRIKTDVLSGTHTYDIALTHVVIGLSSMVTSNILYNWAQMPNVNFERSYWNPSVNEYLNIEGYMPFVLNDFVLPDPIFVLFNKNLLREYALEDPYEFVKSGKWTWDKLTEMAKQVSKDLDGDGKFTTADLYGFSSYIDAGNFINAMYSCNQKVTEKDAGGRYVLTLNTEKSQSIIEKLYDLVYVGNQTYTYKVADPEEKKITFDNGRILFYLDVSRNAKALRATEVDFGIIPMPKYDENQKEYINLSWTGYMCSPINIENPEKVGAVAEYLGAISKKTVIPAFYDILLNGKVIRDDESREMLDIIYGSITCDFGFTFSGYNDLLRVMDVLLGEKNTNFTSYYEKKSDVIQKQYDEVYEACIANLQN